MPDPVCPHCGCNDPSLLTRWLEPKNQVLDAAQQRHDGGMKFYCERCGRTWVVQKLPLEGPDGRT